MDHSLYLCIRVSPAREVRFFQIPLEKYRAQGIFAGFMEDISWSCAVAVCHLGLK